MSYPFSNTDAGTHLHYMPHHHSTGAYRLERVSQYDTRMCKAKPTAFPLNHRCPKQRGHSGIKPSAHARLITTTVLSRREQSPQPGVHTPRNAPKQG